MVATSESYTPEHDEAYEPVNAFTSFSGSADNRSAISGTVPIVPFGESTHRSRRSGAVTHEAPRTPRTRRSTYQASPRRLLVVAAALTALVLAVVLIVFGLVLLT